MSYYRVLDDAKKAKKCTKDEPGSGIGLIGGQLLGQDRITLLLPLFNTG